VGCCVSWAWRGEGGDRKTPSYTSSKPNGWMGFLPKWHLKAFPDMVETQRNRCTTTRPTHTANCIADDTSARNATRPNWWSFCSWYFQNCPVTCRICISTYISLPCLIFYAWCICPQRPAQYRFWSRYADRWRNIHRSVHYLLCGNAANIHFEEQSSMLSKPASDDEHWSNGKGFCRVLLFIYRYY